MNQGWELLLQFLLLCVMLGIATILKLNIKFLQKHLIPTAMIAGFLGLGLNILSESVFSYTVFDRVFLGKLVYHLMGVGFIAMALKDRKKKRSKSILNTGYAIINTYAWQAIVGLAVALLLVFTIFPDLCPLIGMLLPLSFAQGPGQANNIGMSWEVYGFIDGGNVGLTMATFGFLWAFIAGIPLINYLTKRRTHQKNRFDAREANIENIDFEPDNTAHTSRIPKSIYVDDFTIQLVLIGVVYAATYGLLMLLDYLVRPLGNFATTLTDLFWGFNFLFGTLLALLTKRLMRSLRKRNVFNTNYVDNYSLQRISAGSFDIMITAGIAAISISVLYQYFWPIVIITTVGGLFTMFYVVFLAKRIYDENVLENIAGLYGMWTGTITTGVALLREVDPESKTNVAENLVLGSGFAAGMAVPLMLILPFAVQAYAESRPILYLVTFVLLFIYSALMILAMYLTNKRYAKKTPKAE